MTKYNPQTIEKKWQKYWEKNPKLNQASEDSDKPKKYVLDMFPYPSGAGLHAGHVESYTATDIYSRYLRLRGFNVIHPQGWDAFGLPAENYAIKTGVHPSKTTKEAIATFKKQMNSIGFSYDWSREVNSSEPEYYKWTQWFFLLLYENGLAYKAKSNVNWCESCQTVLANEQAEGGICERCKNEVIQKDLEQWFFKITDFIETKDKATGLLDGLDKIDWPESTKAAQKNWIGRSEGAQFKMQIKDSNDFLEVYTTRMDTVFGMTYVVVAPEHKLISDLKAQIKNYNEVEKYVIEAQSKTDLERTAGKVPTITEGDVGIPTASVGKKSGVELKGVKAINPFNSQAVPVFVADYVLGHYGTGAVMAVPAHDERDFEFAKKYGLPIMKSIDPCFCQTTEPGKIKDGEPFVERNAITVLVKHWEKDEYLTLKWKQVEWRTLITGGIEKGQTAEEAARAEVAEETGYKNLKLIKELSMVHSKFYHVPKKENRFAHFKVFYFQLKNGEQKEISEKENEIHEVVWVSKDKMDQYFTAEGHNYVWQNLEKSEKAFCDDGVVTNSGEYNNLTSEEARQKMTEWLEKNKLGSRKINYRMRDWLVSRQRYWGAPIPIVYCEKCGEVPVPEKDLPVVLPMIKDFTPKGKSPLAVADEFMNVKCPKCGGNARRESDTMDTFVCSSWYYLRYADPKNNQEFASKKQIEKWLPVDLYLGGAEHTVLHLLYSRFFTKVLNRLGYVSFDEPFLKLRHQGIILGEDGRKMSKSFGNVANPDEYVKEFGADSLRMYEMFMGPLEAMKPWSSQGIIGVYRFLEKVWKLQDRITNQESGSKDFKLDGLLQKTIKKVTEDIEGFKFNTAISSMMILINVFEKEEEIPLIHYSKFLILLSPFAPHLAEELWSSFAKASEDEEKYKKSIFLEKWPEFDPQLIQDEEIAMAVQFNGKTRGTVLVSPEVSESEAKEKVLVDDKLQKYLTGKEIRKVIFVKGRLINFVVSI